MPHTETPLSQAVFQMFENLDTYLILKRITTIFLKRVFEKLFFIQVSS